MLMNSLRGQLLIASPDLHGPMFARSVILMLDHGAEGAMGVILNQPMKTVISDLSGKIFEDEFEWEKPLHLGGPVPGTLLVLHDIEEMADREIIPGVYMTIEASSVQEVIRRRPEPSLVIANYAGWGPGQLEDEFGLDSWVTLPATPDFVFWSGDDDLWRVVTRRYRASQLSQLLNLRTIPRDPSLN